MTKKNLYKTKKYLHFDSRVGYKNVENYVTNPNEIKTHGFFPLIYYAMDSESYDEDYIDIRDDMRPIKESPRKIMYASHLDNFIYKYYSVNLNTHYNDWANCNSINNCSTAYRNNKPNKSNIDFSAEVINEINSVDHCFIMVGDFEKFFDYIDHSFLKERLQDVLQIEHLSDDWYKVFKSITKYNYIEKEFINSKLGTDKELKTKNKLSYFSTIKDFRNFKKEFKCIKRNPNNFGIPQGSAISAVFANVYTTLFDKKINDLATKYNGLYRRYSDDFILVIPKSSVSEEGFISIVKLVECYTYKNKLSIQPDKTKLYEFKHKRIFNLADKKQSKIDYLGFVFDGITVKMRSKSPYKFYRNAYKLIDKAKRTKKKKSLKRIPYRRKIYRVYTELGVSTGNYGNFITYAKKSQLIFNQLSPNTNNLMMQQIKNRTRKIEKRLGYTLNIKNYE